MLKIAAANASPVDKVFEFSHAGTCPKRGVRGRPLLFQRRPDPLRNHGRIVVDSEFNGTLKSMRPRYQDAGRAIKWVHGYPGFMRTTYVFAARDHGRLDSLTTVTGNTFDSEDCKRHRSYCSEAWTTASAG